MRVGLVDLKDPRHVVVDKTIAGGMGTASKYGKGLFSTTLTRVKAEAIHLLPYNVAYAAALLRAQGHEVLYCDDPLNTTFDLALVFTAIPSLTVDLAYLQKARGVGLPTVVVGTLAGAVPDRFGDANLVLKGEVEAWLLSGWELARVAAMRGEVVETGFLPNLDVLPFPDWSIFPRLNSRYAIVDPVGTVLPVVASRGCPYPCGYYCPYPLGDGKNMRFRSPASVVEELRKLGERYGVSAVKFRDPIFTVNEKRTLALLDELDGSGLKVRWGCETHLNVLNEPLLRRMAASGCRLIQTGIETTEPDTIKASRRKTTEEAHQEEMLHLCVELGIQTALYFIVGQPQDTVEGMRRSLGYATRVPGTFIQITACTPYPGTAFYQDVKDRLLTDDWDRLDQYTPVLRGDGFSPEDLPRLMSHGYRRFYLRPAWIKNFLKVQWRGRATPH